LRFHTGLTALPGVAWRAGGAARRARLDSAVTPGSGRRNTTSNIFYIIGVIVVGLAILGYLGIR